MLAMVRQQIRELEKESRRLEREEIALRDTLQKGECDKLLGQVGVCTVL